MDVVVVDSVAALTPQAEIDGEIGDAHVGLQARLMSQAMRKLTATLAQTNMRHTKDILSRKDYDPDIFVAVNYCNNYSTEGTKPGDWYMPAIGECLKIAQNMLIINMSLSKAGLDTFDLHSSMWSSSTCCSWGDSYAWSCGLSCGKCRFYGYGRVYSCYVCPCLAFIDKV